MFDSGGYDRGYCLDTIEQYDPIRNEWSRLPPVMNNRRGRVSAAILNQKIYVFGGSDGQQELDTGECLDLTKMNKWLPIQSLEIPIAHGGLF